jgi:hypothetical protein
MSLWLTDPSDGLISQEENIGISTHLYVLSHSIGDGLIQRAVRAQAAWVRTCSRPQMKNEKAWEEQYATPPQGCEDD